MDSLKSKCMQPVSVILAEAVSPEMALPKVRIPSFSESRQNTSPGGWQSRRLTPFFTGAKTFFEKFVDFYLNRY